MPLIAHLSDPHLDGSAGRADRFRAAVALVAPTLPHLDAVVVSGDLAHDGTPEQYAQAREILAPLRAVPVLCCPGNRDDRAAFRAGLLKDTSGSTAPISIVHRTATTSYLLCDSTIPGEPGGHLGQETLDWLRDELMAAGDRPVVVVTHHPPVLVWGQPGDGPELRDRADLLGVLGAAGNVRALLAGHYHVAMTTMAGRIPVRVAPAVGFAARMDWEEQAERFDHISAPMVAFHEIGDDGQVTTVVRAATT
ncbi:MAG TPA: metallophosphoesterase [Thermomicrobiales bacterium]|jgi:3',5'-cyclic AMP phosphodiesterase CpdA|nr:metallophosphoesterase [Thermomicrobiales bacterium]